MAKPKALDSSLQARVLSGLILLPASLGLLMAGPPYSDGFIIILTILLLKEWACLCFNSVLKPTARFLWLTGGCVYILVACSLFASLGHYGAIVLQLLLILGAATTDTCAYFVGRWLQGPKLAPNISPSKTWSGAIGGIIGAQIVLNALLWISISLIDARHLSPSLSVAFLFLGFIFFLSIVAECGDLLESWAKRRLGVKDSGSLIPGHGGLLDRLDSLLPLAIIVGAVVAGMGGF